MNLNNKSIKCLWLIRIIMSCMLMFTSCSKDEVETDDEGYDKDAIVIDVEELGSTVLEETDDAGQEYLDNTLFIGDSNTVRTMMYGYTTWDNVVAAVSMGVQHICTLDMTYFKGYSNPVTVIEAVEIIQPQRIIVTYGTNNLRMDTDEFIKTYTEALEKIKDAYEYADIIVNAIPPLDKERENTALTMQMVDEKNLAIAEMCEKEGYKFLNTSEALKDEDTGWAKKDYTISDGVHLSMAGMEARMTYIKTHAYITEDTRPKPLKTVPEREETPTGIISEDPIAVRGSKITVSFVSSDLKYGSVSGDTTQKLKRGYSSEAVTAVADTSNGGYFAGWSCSFSGLSSSENLSVTYTVPSDASDDTAVTVMANFKKAEISLNKSSVTVKESKTEKLSASITPEFTGDRTVIWTSSDNSIAKVNDSGIITAVSEGTVTVTAKISCGVYAECRVTVEKNTSTASSEIQDDSSVQDGITKTDNDDNKSSQETANSSSQEQAVIPETPEQPTGGNSEQGNDQQKDDNTETGGSDTERNADGEGSNQDTQNTDSPEQTEE